jgi:hypothetical protein
MDRTNLLDTIIKSGVGPRDEESVAEYMKRAIEHPAEGTIVDGYGGFKVNEGEAHIYGDTKGHLVVFGGDGRARLTVATEFLRTHPEADVYMNGKNEKDVMVAMPYQFVQGRLLMDTRPRSGIERLFNTNRAAKEITPKSLKAVIY